MSADKKDSDNVGPQTVEQTVECFRKGMNCAQAMLSTYGPHYGLDRENAIRLARAFGSGMGTGETCGAVTGALMVIGLKHARLKGGSLFSKDRTDDIAREFVARFKARNGATVCRELLGCDLSSPKGITATAQKIHRGKHCHKFVRDAAEILEEVLVDGPG